MIAKNGKVFQANLLSFGIQSRFSETGGCSGTDFPLNGEVKLSSSGQHRLVRMARLLEHVPRYGVAGKL